MTDDKTSRRRARIRENNLKAIQEEIITPLLGRVEPSESRPHWVITPETADALGATIRTWNEMGEAAQRAVSSYSPDLSRALDRLSILNP